MTRNSIGKTLSATLVAFLLVSPVSAAFAKENGSERGKASLHQKTAIAATSTKEEKDKNEKKEGKENGKRQDSCMRAFGHLIAPGWIRLHGEVGVSGNCALPFGIGKKFGGNASTTADTIAPVISDITTTPGLTDAMVSWKTNEASSGDVFYSTSSPVNVSATTTLRASDGFHWFGNDNHSVVLRGLAASTTYRAVIVAYDRAGNKTVSSEFSFTTKAPVTQNDTTSPVITSIATVSGSTSVAVGWKTDEPATTKVLYSASTPVNVSASTTSSVGSDDLTTVHFVLVPNLATSTRYYFAAQSKDAAGNATVSAEFSAMTSSGM